MNDSGSVTGEGRVLCAAKKPFDERKEERSESRRKVKGKS
jgi:hypothetical protein